MSAKTPMISALMMSKERPWFCLNLLKKWQKKIFLAIKPRQDFIKLN